MALSTGRRSCAGRGWMGQVWRQEKAQMDTRKSSGGHQEKLRWMENKKSSDGWTAKKLRGMEIKEAEMGHQKKLRQMDTKKRSG